MRAHPRRGPDHSANADWYRVRYQLAALQLNRASQPEDGQREDARDPGQRAQEERLARERAEELALLSAEALVALEERHRKPWVRAWRGIVSRVGPERRRARRAAEGELVDFLTTTILPSALVLLAGALLLEANRAAGTHASSPALESPWDLRDALAAKRIHEPEPLVEYVEAEPELAPRVHYNLGCYYARRGELELAEERLERAMLRTSLPERPALLRAIGLDSTLDLLCEDKRVMKRLEDLALDTRSGKSISSMS